MSRTYKIIVMLIISSSIMTGQVKDKDVVYLQWEEVVSKTLNSNLGLKYKELEVKSQNYTKWNALSQFLPSIEYQGMAVNNLELPVFVFMGQTVRIGADYNFQHTLQFNLPIFTGGSRWFNYNIQKNLKKSLKAELTGMEEATVLSALQSYYGIILSKSLVEASREAVNVAEANMNQVQKFFDVGQATSLDLQRARAEYYSRLPQLETALNDEILAYQNLKYILNVPLSDSLVVLDTLATKSFLGELEGFQLQVYKDLAQQNRADLEAADYRFAATKEGEKISFSQFLPNVVLSGNVQHQAQTDDINVAWDDYIRSKTLVLSVNLPLFSGGRRVIDYQQAKIRTDQMRIMKKQAIEQADLDVEGSYYNYKEAIKNLESYEEAFKQAKESFRIANLLYGEGMSAQLDVLNAQLFYTQSQVQYLQGIYAYNVSQLALLNSIGLLNRVWE